MNRKHLTTVSLAGRTVVLSEMSVVIMRTTIIFTLL